eukprot:Skav234683  [mRNA]  locus=scaffold3643:33967:37467:- [translate_table: standard]
MNRHEDIQLVSFLSQHGLCTKLRGFQRHMATANQDDLNLNCRRVLVPPVDQGQHQRGSFVLFGRALGPSPLSHVGFEHHVNSEFVDIEREYEYPRQYQSLKALALLAVLCFGYLFVFGGMQFQSYNYVGVVAALGLCFGGKDVHLKST